MFCRSGSPRVLLREPRHRRPRPPPTPSDPETARSRRRSRHLRREVHMAHNGKHALVTGSSRGIGRGIALKLAERGVKVAITYHKNAAAAQDTLTKVRQRGSDGFTVQRSEEHTSELQSHSD